MNPLNNFTCGFVILHIDFLKIKLIRYSSMEYLSIFFTYPKICNSQNHSNPSQHTSVLELPDLRHTRLLSQVIVLPLVIKWLQLQSAKWEKVCTHLLNCHIILPHLHLIFAQIWFESLMVVIWNCYVNLCPRVLLILWIVLPCVLPQYTSDVSLSLHCREDASSSQNPSHISSVISKNTEGEHPYFSSTPLHDSSNHEDPNKHPKFYDCCCRDLCTYSFDHNVDPLIVNISKPLVSDDLSINEVETPQAIEAPQPKLMVMVGAHYHKVSSTSNQKIFETPKAPHHSLLHVED